MKDNSLDVSRVSKNFGTPDRPVSVLRDVSFHMDGGQSLAVTGASGSGKSTLLHLLGTLDTPSSAHTLTNGTDLSTYSEHALARFRNHGIGFVFQDHHLLPQYSLLENVMLPTLAFSTHDSDVEKHARSLLEHVALQDRLDFPPAELSGGERQRAAVVRALMNRPGLLLCDEPTGNLDHTTAATVASLLLELHRSEQNILIVVTHNLEIAAGCDRCIDLREGMCVEV